MDAELRAIEREWRAAPSGAALDRMIAAFDRARADLPWEALLVRPRWRPLVVFVERWFERAPTPADGFSVEEIRAAEARLGHPFPRALGEWLRLFGRWREVARAQHPSLWVGVPEEAPAATILPRVVGGAFFVWGTGGDERSAWTIREEALGEEDPPVFLSESGNVRHVPTLHGYGNHLPERFRLSELALLVAHYHALGRRWMTGMSPFIKPGAAALEAAYPRLAVPRWEWPYPGDPSRFHGDEETLIFLAGNFAEVSTLTAEAWQRVRRIADEAR